MYFYFENAAKFSQLWVCSEEQFELCLFLERRRLYFHKKKMFNFTYLQFLIIFFFAMKNIQVITKGFLSDSIRIYRMI